MYKSLWLENQKLHMISILKNSMFDPSTETGDWNGANKLMSIPLITQPDQTICSMNDAHAACSIGECSWLLSIVSSEKPTTQPNGYTRKLKPSI